MDKEMIKAMMMKEKGMIDPKMKAKMEAKMEVLKELMQMADSSEAEGLLGGMDDMKQVTVAAEDKEGLEEGLEKAEEVLDEMPMDDEEDMITDDEEEDEDEEEAKRR